MTRLGLGCVQLGVPYGNAVDQQLMETSDAIAILQAAAENGIEFYDTAFSYGESESRIGTSRIASKYPKIEISTKIPPVDRDIWQSEDKYWNFVKNCIATSLRRLNLSRLRLLQFHQCDSEFLSSPQVHRVLANLVADGFCEQIGVSVYGPEQAEICLETGLVQTIQVPFNLVDRRFFSTRLLNSYASSSVSLIRRSIFLQGVLIPGARLPPVKKSKLLLELRRSLETALEGQGTYQCKICIPKHS
jgi:aryl-alcohol dehydrogenase-like predicted oxidoreductase